MRNEPEYHVKIDLAKLAETSDAIAQKIFDLVWRYDFTAPGFCLLDVGANVHSLRLRSQIVHFKERFTDIAVSRGSVPFFFRLMARFDQQNTTKFHLDGGPAHSMLILGYEPSKVQSRLLLADYAHAAFDKGLTPQELMRQFNPIYRQGEELLAPYTTELPPPLAGDSRILFINNSSLPFSEKRTNSLGVLHKAEILNPTDGEPRIVNSTMLVIDKADECSSEQQHEFVTTDRISPKNY